MDRDDPTPEADQLEQQRPALERDLDPEAPADSDASIPDTTEANLADVLDQFLEAPVDDEYRTETE